VFFTSWLGARTLLKLLIANAMSHSQTYFSTKYGMSEAKPTKTPVNVGSKL